MIFIGGIDAKQAEIGQFHKVLCPSCKESHPMTLYKNYYFFHFFFLPLFKWNVKYAATCHGCHALMDVTSEKGKALEKGQIYDIDTADLTLLEAGHKKPSLCWNCHREVESGFKFCPHCGETIEHLM